MKTAIIFVLFTTHLFALNLNEAINELQKNNHDIKITQQDIQNNKVKLLLKKSSNFGSFDLIGSYTKYNEKRTLAPLAAPISSDVTTSDEITSLGVTYSVNLFNGFKTSNETYMSELSTKISKEQQKLTLNEKVYFVQTIYLDILSLQNILNSQQEYNKALNNIKKTIDLEIKYGKKPYIDLLKIDADIQKNIETITQLETKIEILKATLSITIYGKLQALTPLEDTIDGKFSTSFDIESLPTITIAKTQANKAKKNYKSSLSSYYPNINFQTSYSNSYGAGDKEMISSAAINLNWKIFDFGVREKTTQLAKIEQMKSILEYEKLKLTYENKIFEAKNLIVQNEKLLQSSLSQADLSKKIKQIEELKYKEGKNSINDFLLAFSNEKINSAQLIESKYKLLKSQFYLEFLTKE